MVFTSINIIYNFNSFLANIPILQPLKISENLWSSGIFRGYKIRTLAKNWLRIQMLFSGGYKMGTLTRNEFTWINEKGRLIRLVVVLEIENIQIKHKTNT